MEMGMQNTPGARPHIRQHSATATPEFSEEQLIAFDRGYALAKDTGALDRLRIAAAANIELSHNRAERLA